MAGEGRVDVAKWKFGVATYQKQGSHGI